MTRRVPREHLSCPRSALSRSSELGFTQVHSDTQLGNSFPGQRWAAALEVPWIFSNYFSEWLLTPKG